MEAKGITVTELVPASRKLSKSDARQIAKAAGRVIVAKGKKVDTFQPAGKATAELITKMLGPTGNLRSPLMRVGKLVLVGFDQEIFEKTFG